MILSSTFRIAAETYVYTTTYSVEVDPSTLTLSAYNVASTDLSIAFYSYTGDVRSPYQAYLTLQVLSGDDVLYSYKPSSPLSTYTYQWPSDSYATADSILVICHSDSARATEVGRKTVTLVTENPIPFPRSETEWDSSLTFKNGEYILIDGVVYMWVSRVPGNTDVDPKTYISNGTVPRVWVSYTQWALLATQVLLADFALVGGAVFNGDYMLSRTGTDGDGNESDDYRNFPDGDFTPYLWMNFKTGETYQQKATIEGDLKAGTVGDFVINEGIYNTDENPTAYIKLGTDGGNFVQLRISDTEEYIEHIRSNTRGCLYLANYGSGKNTLYIIANQASNAGITKAIEAHGHVELLARAGGIYNEFVNINGLKLNTRRISASSTLYSNDDIIIANGTSVSITLPVGSDYLGKEYTIINANTTNGLTITPESSILYSSVIRIMGNSNELSTYTLSQNKAVRCVHFIATAAIWYLLPYSS